MEASKTASWKLEPTLHRHNTENSKQIFPYSCVCERFICYHDRSAIGKYVDLSWEYINRSQNLEIGTEVAKFPERENINGIFVAVWRTNFKITGSKKKHIMNYDWLQIYLLFNLWIFHLPCL
jgi:hypothetical protein